MDKLLDDLDAKIAHAIAHYWAARERQAQKQVSSGRADQGARSAVTGGSQMDQFISLITEIVEAAGINERFVFRDRSLELPGFFRPEKKWDLLIVRDGQLIAALEAKSQVGPSFGNNFNNRTEEAMGSALDLWTAYREGAFNKTIKPWLGYLFLLEDSQASQRPVKVKEPHFAVLPEFKDASYARRYELFCRKLVRERHYSASAFLLSERHKGLDGHFVEPADDLTFEFFARSLIAQAIAYGQGVKE